MDILRKLILRDLLFDRFKYIKLKTLLVQLVKTLYIIFCKLFIYILFPN